MTAVSRAVLWCVRSLVLIFAASAAGQELRFVHPEKFERATKTDDAGLEQWDVHAKVDCPTCKGKGKMKCTTCERFKDEIKTCAECGRNPDREAVCRACAGVGTFSDPLEKALCPGCQGAGFLECQQCTGALVSAMNDKGKWGDCVVCRGTVIKCTVCDGKRLVEVAALKPSLKDANSAALKKAIDTTTQVLAGLAAFAPKGGDGFRKESKELAKQLQLGEKLFPPLKREVKALDDYVSKMGGLSTYQGSEEREARALTVIKNSAEYYLKHQKRMMELCLKRAEANEKLAAENKPAK